jgi:hypothetical protein
MRRAKSSNLVLNLRKYILTGAAFSLLSAFLYAFLLGLIEIPFVGIMSLRMIPVTIVDIVFLPTISIGTGIVAAVYAYRLDNIKSTCNKKLCVGSAGAATGFITAVCPLCNVFLFSLIGITFTFAFLSPYFFGLRILSMVLIFISSFMMLRDIRRKPLRTKR